MPKTSTPHPHSAARHEDAATSPLAFVVAGVILIASIGAVLHVSSTGSVDQDQVLQPAQDAQASALLSLLVDSQGSRDGSDAWQRIGLRDPNGTGLDVAQLRLLQGLSLGADPDRLIHRDELLASLGLDPQAWGLHLRIHPKHAEALPVEAPVLGPLRTAYIGDWQGLTKVSVRINADVAMMESARAQLELDALPAARNDRATLQALGLDFDNRIHIGVGAPTIMIDLPLGRDLPLTARLGDVTLLPGDVYPDQKQYLNSVLPGRLAEYDVLIVGSDVDHTALTSSATKTAIADWVRAGGRLIVFGTPAASGQWLQPLYMVDTDPTTADPHAPDPDHPALHHPHPLTWSRYDNQGTAWDMGKVPTTERETVLVAGKGAMIAFLEGPSTGTGHVALTSVDLGALVESFGADEAQHLLTNLVLWTRSSVVTPFDIDYGDPVPSDLPVSSATRSTVAWYPGYGQTTVDVQLLVWRTHLETS